MDPETGLIDYDGLRKQALLFRPKLIIVGSTSYPRDFNYECMREVIACNSFINELFSVGVAHKMLHSTLFFLHLYPSIQSRLQTAWGHFS